MNVSRALKSQNGIAEVLGVPILWYRGTYAETCLGYIIVLHTQRNFLQKSSAILSNANLR